MELPAVRRNRTPTMDALMKSIHGNPKFSFENACKALDEAVKRK